MNIANDLPKSLENGKLGALILILTSKRFLSAAMPPKQINDYFVLNLGFLNNALI